MFFTRIQLFKDFTIWISKPLYVYEGQFLKPRSKRHSSDWLQPFSHRFWNRYEIDENYRFLIKTLFCKTHKNVSPHAKILSYVFIAWIGIAISCQSSRTTNIQKFQNDSDKCKFGDVCWFTISTTNVKWLNIIKKWQCLTIAIKFRKNSDHDIFYRLFLLKWSKISN